MVSGEDFSVKNQSIGMVNCSSWNQPLGEAAATKVSCALLGAVFGPLAYLGGEQFKALQVHGRCRARIHLALFPDFPREASKTCIFGRTLK